MAANNKTVRILGIRGIPAAHGGFETFAAQLAPYLSNRGWSVTVYCQLEPDANGVLADNFEDDWEGVHRVHLGSKRTGSTGSFVFDWRCLRHAFGKPGLNLVLGYNTALIAALLRFGGAPMLMNMDGVEWQRAKWSFPIKAWFYLNEFIGYHASSMPIADHPEIARHLRRHGPRDATVIPYGADLVTQAPAAPVVDMGLEPGGYVVSIARIEPENSLLEIVSAYSRRKRAKRLVVLGRFDEQNSYHRAVRAAASDQVLFPGAIYEKDVVAALRYHALAYVHGHQVGGTNPSLVEALAAGNPIIAHDNRFNRWVAGEGQFYFGSADKLDAIFSAIDNGGQDMTAAREAARQRHAEQFTTDGINARYEAVLEQFL